MKKFFKVFITIVVIVGAVLGTTFLFFKNIIKQNNKTGSIVNMLKSENKQLFNARLNTVDAIVDKEESDKEHRRLYRRSDLYPLKA